MEEIRKQRLRHNLTQRQLAEKIGVKPSFLCLVENGKKKASLQLLKKVAYATNSNLTIVFSEIHNCESPVKRVEYEQKAL